MFSLFVVNGPYVVDKNIKVSTNNYSWAQEFSMLYVDNPIGSGFSFTHDKNGFSRDQKTIADNLYEALQQFFTLFHDYRKNDFYIAGESYGGKYVPAIGYKLHTMREVSNINFKGCAIGDGWIDPISMLGYGPYLKNIGLIDENQMKHFDSVQNITVSEILKGNYSNAFKIHSLVLCNSIF
jgi:vitellogenic carboxypeptidase-like protein